MKVVNGTTHSINLYSLQDTITIQDGRKLVLKEGATPLFCLAPGTNLNAVKVNAELPVHLQGSGLPLKGGVKFVSHDPIPDGDIVIVSNLYRSAVKELGNDTSRLATVDGVVYKSESDMRPCGCLGLAVG